MTRNGSRQNGPKKIIDSSWWMSQVRNPAHHPPRSLGDSASVVLQPLGSSALSHNIIIILHSSASLSPGRCRCAPGSNATRVACSSTSTMASLGFGPPSSRSSRSQCLPCLGLDPWRPWSDQGAMHKVESQGLWQATRSPMHGCERQRRSRRKPARPRRRPPQGWWSGCPGRCSRHKLRHLFNLRLCLCLCLVRGRYDCLFGHVRYTIQILWMPFITVVSLV